MIHANIASEQELSRTWQIFRFQNGRECTVGVDLAIDGSRPSSASRRREKQGQRGDGRGSYLPAARVGVGCGCLGVRLGGVVLVGEAPGVGGEQHGHEAVVANLGNGLRKSGHGSEQQRYGSTAHPSWRCTRKWW